MDAQDWDERYASRELVWSAEPNRFLVEQTDGLRAGRALDLAAGEGRNALWLAERGWRVTAVDWSAVGIDKGREAARRRGVEIEWLVADVTTWQPPDEAYDLVIVFYLQLPETARRVVHREAARAVAPTGTLLIVGHDRDNLERGVGGPQEAAVLLTVDDVVGDLSATGLVVEEAGQVLRPVEDETGEVHQAIDCLVRGRRPLEGTA